LQALSTSGHSAAVLCLEDADPKKWPVGITQLAWPTRPPHFSWFNVPALSASFKRVVAEYAPDVIHAGPIQQTAFIAALAGCHPLLSMSWGSDLIKDAERNPIWRCVTNYTLKHTDVLAADCKTVVDAGRKHGFRGPARIFPWGVDLQHFKPEAKGLLRKRLGWEKNVVFLCNRTMEPLYGVDLVARAFASAAAKEASIRLMLFGKGSQEPAIRAILENAGVLERVHFGGFASLQDLPDVYASTDFYVSASHSDGSSVSLMEALACAKPVILSDIPSNREWIEEGKEGWFFADNSAAELENCLLNAAVMSNYKRMSSAARTLAAKRADWQKNFAVLLSAYAEAVEIGKKSHS
jgi:glycosyltransferase involved in cell wall biosynthesis